MVRGDLERRDAVLQRARGLLAELSRRLQIGGLSLAALACSNYATPHLPYAPLFDRAGQLDLAVSGGASGDAAPSFAAHAAIAPIDHLQVVADLDFDPIREGNGTRHVAGSLGVGVFLMGPPNLRAELVGGVGGGWGSGRLTDFEGSRWWISGPYVRPYAQGTVAGRFGPFLLGGGLRLAMTRTDLSYRETSGTFPHPDGPAMQAHIDPYATLRFRHELLSVEVTGGASLSAGDHEVGRQINGYGALGLHLHVEAWAPR